MDTFFGERHTFAANFTKIGENAPKGHSSILKTWNWHFFHFWLVFASAGFEPVTLKNQINEYFLYHIQGFKYRTPKNMQKMKKIQIWVFHHWSIPKWATFTNFGEICSKIEPVTEKSALQKNMAVASFRQNFKKCKFA